MQTKILQLVRPVLVEGLSLFAPGGAKVNFFPPKQGREFEWTYVSPFEVTQINTENVCARTQNLSVVHAGHTMAHVLEHLLPLKFFGLQGLGFSSTHCLPYFGNGLPFVDQVLQATREISVDLPVYTVSRECAWFYPKERAGRKAFTALFPRKDDKIVMHITIDYPGLGFLTKTYTLPDDELLRWLSSVCAQGWPKWRYGVSKVLSKVGLWKHHDSVEWPQYHESEKSVVLDRFVDHRALDLLGSLALLVNGCRLSVDVISVCSGHIADLNACREASKYLVSTA